MSSENSDKLNESNQSNSLNDSMKSIESNELIDSNKSEELNNSNKLNNNNKPNSSNKSQESNEFSNNKSKEDNKSENESKEQSKSDDENNKSENDSDEKSNDLDSNENSTVTLKNLNSEKSDTINKKNDYSLGNKTSNDDEEDDEDDDDEDDDDDDDEKSHDYSFNSNSSKKSNNPYKDYISSNIFNKNFLNNLSEKCFLYGKEQKKFYKVIKKNEDSDDEKDHKNFRINLEVFAIPKSKQNKKIIHEYEVLSNNIKFFSDSFNNKINNNNIDNLNIKEKIQNSENDKKEKVKNKEIIAKKECNENREENAENKEISNNKEIKDNTGNRENSTNKLHKENKVKKENKDIKETKENHPKEKIIQKQKNVKDKKDKKIKNDICNTITQENNKFIFNFSKILTKLIDEENELIIEKGNANDTTKEGTEIKNTKSENSEKNINEISITKIDFKENNNNNTTEKKNSTNRTNSSATFNVNRIKINEKKSKKKLKKQITITLKDYSKYTCFQKVKVYYINYLNYRASLTMIININWHLNQFLGKFGVMYHLPCSHSASDKSGITLFIKNKKYTTNVIRNSEKKIFGPSEFDYSNDYVIILENENFNKVEIDLGRRNSYMSLKGEKIPHLIINSDANLEIECMLISKCVTLLECEIYEVKKEFNFFIEYNNNKNLRKKARDFLSTNWKEKCIFVDNIRSTNYKKSDNYDANYFVINEKIILPCGKIFIFIVSTPNKTIYAFHSMYDSREGLYIITKDKKGVLIGFSAKKRSDFVVANSY